MSKVIDTWSKQCKCLHYIIYNLVAGLSIMSKVIDTWSKRCKGLHIGTFKSQV